jgi:antitoxin (DNA-binding transcriptional repressor) of toxin-antitoxin stability system
MDINVSELKAHLSKYLRRASRGARIVVRDRDEAIAQIGPPTPTSRSWSDRLHDQGRLRPGSQDWASLSITRPPAPVDIQASLRAVREDPNDVRGR